MTNILPIIYGLQGLKLDAEERAFFKDATPAGYILFKRNCDTPDQVRGLTDSLRDLHSAHIPILIDQEGGRVQRLRQPNFVETPALKTYKNREEELIRDQTKLAQQLFKLGITVNCTPVLDLVPEHCATDAIGDRSFGSDPDEATAYGALVCEAHVKAGITPVIKHLPGHGRATVDSHHALPSVVTCIEALNSSDFVPFKKVAALFPQAWGMTTHIIFEDCDRELPVTLSSTALNQLVRTACGFNGMLVTDDLFMDALKPFGTIPDRLKLSLSAGVDLALHCHGTVDDMLMAANICPAMKDDTRTKLDEWVKAQQ